jgi:hypothetical protein
MFSRGWDTALGANKYCDLAEFGQECTFAQAFRQLAQEDEATVSVTEESFCVYVTGSVSGLFIPTLKTKWTVIRNVNCLFVKTLTDLAVTHVKFDVPISQHVPKVPEKSVFSVLMAPKNFIAPRQQPETDFKMVLFNDLVQLCQKDNAGCPSVEESATFIKTLSDLLWYIEPHHKSILDGMP